MKIREVDIDFSEAAIFWTPQDPEFAQFWNATSTFLPYLEPFLNKTVRKGMEQLGEHETELRRECMIFIGQEGRHYKNHAKFNKKLRENGYPELAAREERMAADYRRFWKEKSHLYCMGYAEGFETLGPVLACFFLEGAKELEQADVDDPTASLWRWHLAEEYEHRCVANYLFHRLYPSYWKRLYGISYSVPHMMNYMIRTALYLIREDRRAGRIPDTWGSRWRFTRMLVRMLAYAIPRFLKTLLPGYDPVRIKPPEKSMQVLDEAEARWGVRYVEAEEPPATGAAPSKA